MRALQQQVAERKRAQRAAAGAAAAGRAADGGGADVAWPTAARAASGADTAAGRPAAKRARREPDLAEVSALRRAEQRGVTELGLVASAAAEPGLADVIAARRAMQDFRGSFAGVGGNPGLERRAAAGQGLGDVPMRRSQSRGGGSTAGEPAALEPWEVADPVRLHEDRRGRAHEAAYSNGVASHAAERSPAADDGGGSTGALPPRTDRRSMWVFQPWGTACCTTHCTPPLFITLFVEMRPYQHIRLKQSHADCKDCRCALSGDVSNVS